MNINFKKFHPNAITPCRATEHSAGADLFAFIQEDVVPGAEIAIKSGSRLLIPTGIAVEIPPGYGGFIFPRSSISTKHGISLANCVGVIDADYRGELKVPLINHSKDDYSIKNGDRIAQIVILSIESPQFIEKTTLSDTVRGSGGFGSTGL